MRLSDEKITDIKEYLNRSIKVTASSLIPQLSKYGIDLIDTIEALRQENNGWQERYYELDAGHSRLFKDFCKLRQENEQLKATLADWKYNAKCDADHMAALTADKDELVKVLKKAREAIQRAKENFEPYGEYEYDVRYDLEEALAEIDKAIGGKEDVTSMGD